MIFLFFGTSLAILEAELAPSKDWQEIEFLNVANFLSIFKTDITSSEQLRKLLISHPPEPRNPPVFL